MEEGATIQIRRALVQRFVPLYAQATGPQKEQVLSAFVLATGYHQRYGTWLLTHPGENKAMSCVGRPRRYGREVQQALEIAWNAANRICAKRLVPFLPELIESLERHKQIQLTPECRAHLLALSASTADRLLYAARTKGARGLSATRAGTLLKQQIPIRPFFQWNEAKPGFLEGDLVAHCGKGLEGTFLYTLTLTDVATGWIECLPVMGRSRELVLAAFQHARTLFPFPILGLDTDGGGEFINEDMVGYCEREQIVLTRGRPYLKNDQAHVEQKNGNLVRQVIGYDRYDGEYACQQIAELYRAWRLYVNCFQPSMKLVISDEIMGSIAQHDSAKTPLQRVLLSGMLTAEREHEWVALSRVINPVRLLEQVEQLQQAALRCAVDVTPLPHRQPATPVLRFHEHLCQAEQFSWTQERLVEREPQPLERRDPLAWPRTRRDPFQGEWEYIFFCLQAMPELTAGVLLRHLQHRTPERYHPGHLRSLQRGLRRLRMALPGVRKHACSEEMTWDAVSPLPSPASTGSKEECPTVSHPLSDAKSFPQARQTSAPSSPETKPPLLWKTRLPQRKMAKSATLTPKSGAADSARQEDVLATISGIPLAHAIQEYLQEHIQANRSLKTLEWHQVALGFLQRYLHSQEIVFVQGLTQDRIQNWIRWLQETPGHRGAMRAVETILTYARSARAFCHWLVQRGMVTRSPFSDMTSCQTDSPPIQVVEPEHFARLLLGCRPPEQSGLGEEMATLRNQALLWLFWEEGLSVSEVCALRIGAVTLHQGAMRLVCPGMGERRIALGQQSQRAMGLYLARLSQQGEALQAEAWLFRTERGDRLTNNAVTLLFARINQRDGVADAHITPSMLRETFAVRYLQSGGQVHALQIHLGLYDRNSMKRFQQAAGLWERRRAVRKRKRRKSQFTRKHTHIHDVCDRGS